MEVEKTIRVLLVEDNPTDVLLLHEALTGVIPEQFTLTDVERLGDGLKRLSEESFDVILLDLGLPDSQGLETFVKMHGQMMEVPIVVLTGLDNGQLGVRAVQEGAQDYLVKGQTEGPLLVRALRYAIERKRLEARQAKLTSDLQDALAQIKTLKGLLSICASCNKIRDDKGHWHQIEAYVSDHSEAQFSHSICPDCLKELYPDIFKKIFPDSPAQNQ
ncbi:MAG: response regulator [Candidatus Tectomicrobia bacterium]|nr:response regulator [Candidatus Tectomicrobia bacterium]